jgi:hypothetical protein
MIVFNVFNVVDPQQFDTKMEKDFGHIKYTVQEFDEEEECLVVEVLRDIGTDFMALEGEKVGPANLSIYLDEKQTQTVPKPQTKPKPQSNPNGEKKRGRLLKG